MCQTSRVPGCRQRCGLARSGAYTNRQATPWSPASPHPDHAIQSVGTPMSPIKAVNAATGPSAKMVMGQPHRHAIAWLHTVDALREHDLRRVNVSSRALTGPKACLTDGAPTAQAGQVTIADSRLFGPTRCGRMPGRSVRSATMSAISGDNASASKPEGSHDMATNDEAR